VFALGLKLEARASIVFEIRMGKFRVKHSPFSEWRKKAEKLETSFAISATIAVSSNAALPLSVILGKVVFLAKSNYVWRSL
jgi:hypothetical protein